VPVKELRDFSFRGFDFSRSIPRIGIFIFSDWSRCPRIISSFTVSLPDINCSNFSNKVVISPNDSDMLS